MNEEAADVFTALADPARRQIVEWLSLEGPASASALARRLPISRQAVMKHLAVLARAGLTVPAREGREVRYRLSAESLTGAMEWMAALAARWDERLEALHRLLERTVGSGPYPGGGSRSRRS